ncbi:hypothetical protein BJ742DRAFT_165158 [Cladochytrium replicatum]|nr:hypothetical protein BJ742DRAFT_165158 [Cladochytrium replicatum]
MSTRVFHSLHRLRNVAQNTASHQPQSSNWQPTAAAPQSPQSAQPDQTFAARLPPSALYSTSPPCTPSVVAPVAFFPNSTPAQGPRTPVLSSPEPPASARFFTTAVIEERRPSFPNVAVQLPNRSGNSHRPDLNPTPYTTPPSPRYAPHQPPQSANDQEDWRDTLNTLGQPHFIREYTLSSFLSALKRRDTRDAWGTFMKMKDSPSFASLSAKDYNYLMQLLRRTSHKFGQDDSERLEALELVFSHMQKVGVQALTPSYVILATAYAQAGNLRKVEHLFAEVERLGLEPPKVKDAILVVALAKSNRAGEAETLFRHILSTHPSIPRIELMGAYNSILESYAHHTDHSHLANWFTAVREFSIVPDGLTYDILIDHYCTRFEIDSARKYLGVKQTLGFIPTTRSYNSLVRALLRNNRHADVLAVFQEMADLSVPANTTTYNYVLASYEGANRPQAVWRVYISMLRAKLIPKRSTWASLAKGIGPNNEDLTEDIAAAGGQPSRVLFRHLMDGYRYLSDSKGVTAVLQQYRFHHGRNPTRWPLTLDLFNTALSCYCECGEESLAIATFDEMRTMRRLDVNRFAYNAMISMYARNLNLRDAGMARTYFDMMVRDGVVADGFSYNQMLNAVWSPGAPLGAEAFEYVEMFVKNGGDRSSDATWKRDTVLARALRVVAEGGSVEDGMERVRRGGIVLPLENTVGNHHHAAELIGHDLERELDASDDELSPVHTTKGLHLLKDEEAVDETSSSNGSEGAGWTKSPQRMTSSAGTTPKSGSPLLEEAGLPTENNAFMRRVHDDVTNTSQFYA